ncbi:hypothetical protein LGN07_10260 [Burkholderia cepacia]|uniref:amidohydrolase family protein n=1 Tax=Burkholderia cepacia TaxID=292 RepID=UPI0012D903E4|nr:amidohydrolase family protein [Burkholderia cepacia]MCA8119098.1 hypothetical protein [Burkholderia cepacia]
MQLISSLLDAGLPIVVDHFDRPDPDRGISNPGVKELLKFGTSGRVWVRVSGVYRCAKPGSNFAWEATDQIINAFGAECMMCGSD